MAALVVAVLADGATYDTETNSPLGIEEERVNTTVEPLTDAFVTVTGSLPTKTVNALPAGPTEPNVSLNVNVTVEPE
jgi:hypothetical protein